MCLRHERTVKLTIEVSLHRLNQSSIVRSVARFNDLPQSVLHQARKDQRASDQQRQRDTVLADVKDASRRLRAVACGYPLPSPGQTLDRVGARCGVLAMAASGGQAHCKITNRCYISDIRPCGLP